MPSVPASGRAAAVGCPARPPYSYAEYLAAPRAVPRARQHTRDALRAWGLDALAGTAELLASELVTNAVRASIAAGQPAVRLLLTLDAEGVRISVWDGAPGVPRRRPDPAGDADGGRGLLLVEALGADYGTYRSAGYGKVVWCVITG
jgi:anti-sigma regulatory factor (Ser/Thr protein kinase)